MEMKVILKGLPHIRGIGDQKDKSSLSCENLFPTEQLQQAPAAHLPQCQILS